MSEARTEPIGSDRVDHPRRAAERTADAGRRTPFSSLVRADLRRLGDTSSGRLLLAAGPLLIVLLNLLSLGTPLDNTVRSQIGITVVAIEFGQLIVHATLIRTITSEWLYRGVQATMLIQPSRRRYLLSQAAVAGLLWLGCATLQATLTFALGPAAAAHSGVPYLLGGRALWVLSICALGSLLGMVATITVSLLLLNPAGALAAYFAAVPVLVILASLVPRLFSWFDPFTVVSELATLDDYAAPIAGVVSLAFWISLLTAAAYRVIRADIE